MKDIFVGINLFQRGKQIALISFPCLFLILELEFQVKCSALQCLHRSLQRQPCDAALPVETNALLVGALRYEILYNQRFRVEMVKWSLFIMLK